jgi:hypothetical protein
MNEKLLNSFLIGAIFLDIGSEFYIGHLLIIGFHTNLHLPCELITICKSSDVKIKISCLDTSNRNKVISRKKLESEWHKSTLIMDCSTVGMVLV